MGSPGVGGSLSAASDVSFNNPAQDELLLRDGSYWKNMTLAGKVALPIKGGVETVSTASVSGSTTLDLANGNVFNLTLTGATTFTFSGATAGKACSFTVYTKQDATGSRTITWPASVKWSGGAPVPSTAANATDIFVFESLDGGTTWFGSLVGLNFV